MWRFKPRTVSTYAGEPNHLVQELRKALALAFSAKDAQICSWMFYDASLARPLSSQHCGLACQVQWLHNHSPAQQRSIPGTPRRSTLTLSAETGTPTCPMLLQVVVKRLGTGATNLENMNGLRSWSWARSHSLAITHTSTCSIHLHRTNQALPAPTLHPRTPGDQELTSPTFEFKRLER